MQKDVKRKNMYFVKKKIAKYMYFVRVLNYSVSYIHILVYTRIYTYRKILKVQKKSFFAVRGGGLRTLRTGPHLTGFFGHPFLLCVPQARCTVYSYRLKINKG